MRTAYTDLNIQTTIDHTVFHILNIAFERFQRPMPAHSHGNDSYELHYIPYGRGKININGILYDAAPKTLYMTGPHIEHEQIPLKEDPMAEYCIYFKLQPQQSLRNDIPVPEHFQGTAGLFAKTHFWFGTDTQDLYPVMQQIFAELEHHYTGYMIQVEALLQQCIVKTVRNYEMEKESVTQFTPSNLVDSKYLIVEESFLYDYETLTLEGLSRRLGLGIRQTERFLKDYYGKTFLQKKAEAKMSMAKIYLLEQDLSISEIAKRLNYSSAEHFAYAFRSFYGVSARDYRKQGKGEAETH
jgi:AraC-like DNA-binding protein